MSLLSSIKADTQEGRHTGGQTHRSAPTNPTYSLTVGANLCVRPGCLSVFAQA